MMEDLFQYGILKTGNLYLDLEMLMGLNKKLPQGVLTILKEDWLLLEKMELLKCGTFQTDSALQSLNQK